jgi:protein-tyrosine phosphatase
VVQIYGLPSPSASKIYSCIQAQDFDPHSLRNILPGAVKAIENELSSGRKVYVHCTAGLGRAPAACIAYIYWFQDFQLEGVRFHTYIYNKPMSHHPFN